MLLVLAPDDDETAAAVAATARNRGVQVLASDRSEVSIALVSDRDGGCAISFAAAGYPLPVTAIFNRWYGDRADERAVRFRIAERMAAWWAVMAQFPGPVVNRPSAQGILPPLEANDLARTAGVPAAARTIATTPASLAGPCNVHRLHDGSHVGLLEPGTADPSNPSEVRRYTRFEPAHAAYAIVAGTRAVHVGAAGPSLAPYIDRLRDAVTGAGVHFAYLVLDTSDTPTLVHASAFPVIGNYAGYEAAVHGGIVDFLTTP